MTKHGTTTVATPEQFVRVDYEFSKALAKAMSGRDPKEVVSAVSANITDQLAEHLGLVLDALQNGQQLVLHVPQFKTLCTVKIGSIKTVEAMRETVTSADRQISDWAEDIMSKPKFAISTEEYDMDIVEVSGEQLGFKEAVPRIQIYERALQSDPTLCIVPPEAGPLIAIEYKNQPKGEWRLIAMEPIADSDGGPRIFGVGRYDGGERWLYAHWGFPDDLWSPGHVWLFGRRKNQS